MRLAVPGALPGIHTKAPLVTSSRALAGIAYQQFANEQLAAGGQSWERPEIYTFEAWLTSIWQEARYSKSNLPALLSPAQEHFLWQEIISARVPDLFDAGSIARLAARAANVAVEYSIPLDHESWAEQQDAEQFHAWFTEFRARCEQNGWMARRDILRCLRPRSQPCFIGFEAAPAPGKLLATQPTGRAPRVGLKQVESFADELELAARWARARFETAPRESVAVFVPGLRTHTAAVERVFRSVFYPGRALDVGAESTESVFHIHAPRPLLEHPLIASALLLLDLAGRRITQANATAILRSPFLGGAREERIARAGADLDLRRTRELDISLYDLQKHSRECPRLQEVWKRVRSVVERRKTSNDFPRWARFFADLLHAAGWPGDWELSAEEQRIVEMWKDALSTLSALGLVSPAVQFTVATGQLRRLLAIGGAEVGDWLSPVQILDAADAPGLAFDAAFLTGLDDETWPQIEPLSPLIPARLQRACGVLGADPASVRKAGLEATRALAHSAPIVYGSHRDRLAPQVRAVARVTRFDAAIWEGRKPIQSFEHSELEEYRETHGPPFDTSTEARGGTRLIKAQSECPFKAFAAHRLRAALPDDASFGFDALDRGGFVHAALETVWKELRTQERLLAATPGELHELVRIGVEKALTGQNGTEFYSETSEVERQRLEKLIYDWLVTVESMRTAPFTVESAEEPMHIELAGLPLSVRLDRIDRLSNGGLVLIDYKSGGNINKNRLIGERPAEPQLLVYAAGKATNIEGLLFGCIVPRDLAFAGFTRSKLINSQKVQVNKDWSGFLREARETVEKLAGEFVRGEAVIRPSKHACQYCDFAPLCRKDEQQQAWTEEE